MRRFGAEDLRKALLASVDALRAHRGKLDLLNVYPVPDGDTGTNLVLTFEAIADALSSARGDDADIAHRIRSGALMGARGNSGVICSQIVRAWADAVELGPAGPDEVARAFKRAVELAYEAVLQPAEGTILSVLRAASEAAQAGGRSVADRFAAAARAALLAVEETPNQMPLLARAGVVDAGGAGLAVVLAAMATALGRPVEAAIPVPPGRDGLPPAACGDPPSFSYEVMYMLDASYERIPALRALLGTIGDSVAVVGDGRSWRVHVHTDEPERALGFGSAVGATRDLIVTSFAEQIAIGQRGAPLAQADRAAAAVVVVDGEGNRRMLEGLGARIAPRPLDLPDAINGVGEMHVIVLPCSTAAHDAALSLADAVEKTLAVIPVVAPAAALSIAAAYGPARSVDDCVADMEEVRARLRTAAADSARGAIEAAGRLLASGGELLTVVRGAHAAELTDQLKEGFPQVEVEVLDGGQQEPRYSVAVE